MIFIRMHGDKRRPAASGNKSYRQQGRHFPSLNTIEPLKALLNISKVFLNFRLILAIFKTFFTPFYEISYDFNKILIRFYMIFIRMHGDKRRPAASGNKSDRQQGRHLPSLDTIEPLKATAKKSPLEAS